MSCARLLAPLRLTLSATTTDTQYEFGDDWFAIDDAAELGAGLEIVTLAGNLQVTVAKQLAAVRAENADNPAIWSGAA